MSQTKAESSLAREKQRDSVSTIPKFIAPLPHHFNNTPASSDDDTSVTDWTDMEARLVVVWNANGITKQRRQDWILQRAKGAVKDYEIKFKTKFSPYDREDIVVATAKCLVEQCAKARAQKANSRASMAARTWK
jgi:hypothetical protein